MEQKTPNERFLVLSKKISIVFLVLTLLWIPVTVVVAMAGGSNQGLVNMYYTVLFYPVPMLISFFGTKFLIKKGKGNISILVSLVPFFYILLLPFLLSIF